MLGRPSESSFVEAKRIVIKAHVPDRDKTFLMVANLSVTSLSSWKTIRWICVVQILD